MVKALLFLLAIAMSRFLRSTVRFLRSTGRVRTRGRRLGMDGARPGSSRARCTVGDSKSAAVIASTPRKRLQKFYRCASTAKWWRWLYEIILRIGDGASEQELSRPETQS